MLHMKSFILLLPKFFNCIKTELKPAEVIFFFFLRSLQVFCYMYKNTSIFLKYTTTKESPAIPIFVSTVLITSYCFITFLAFVLKHFSS